MTEALIILCGGRSRRMGEDKAGLIYQGETLLARHVRLAAQAGMQVYVAGGGTDYPLPQGVQAVDDALPDRAGPLSALAGALRVLQQEGIEQALLMPVDTLIDPAQLQAALPWQENVPFACLVAEGTPQPLFARIAVSLLPRIESWLAADMRRMMPLAAISGVRYAPIPADWLQPFTFNTREDWQHVTGAAA